MEKQEAFNLVKQVCASFKGSLQEHTAIQAAMQVLEPKEDKPKEDLKKSK